MCMSLVLGIKPSVFLHMLVSTLPLTPISLSEDNRSIDGTGIDKVSPSMWVFLYVTYVLFTFLEQGHTG